MFPFQMMGPQPPKELMEELPENVPPDLAIEVWQKAYAHGHEGEEYKLVNSDHFDIAFIYNNGYHRGKSDRELRESLSTKNDEEVEQEEEQPKPPPELVIKAHEFLMTYANEINFGLRVIHTMGYFAIALAIHKHRR